MQEVHPSLDCVRASSNGEALKEAAINARPELDSDTRTDRGSAVDLQYTSEVFTTAEQWQPNFEMFEPDAYDPSPYDAE
jgi:hypothetical protein